VLEFIERVLRFVVDPLMIWVTTLGLLIFLYRRKNSSLRRIVLDANQELPMPAIPIPLPAAINHYKEEQ